MMMMKIKQNTAVLHANLLKMIDVMEGRDISLNQIT